MKLAYSPETEHGGWDYRCCGLEAHKIRQMSDEEYRSVLRPALLWLAVFVATLAVLAIPGPGGGQMHLLIEAAKTFDVLVGLFALWLTVVFGRCAFHHTVMVFHGKPIVADQFKLAGLPCQCPLQMSKEPVTIRVYWPVCLVLVDSDLWQPHPWFRRWPHAVKLVAMARGEMEFSGSRMLNRRERKELAKHAVGALLKVIGSAFSFLVFVGMLGKSFEMFGEHEVTSFVYDYSSHIFWIAIACQFFWIYRATLMLLDCLWGQVFRHPGSEFSWLRISRAMWQRDGQPAKWRENANLMKYPVAALSRYAREILSYHKRGIGNERAI